MIWLIFAFALGCALGYMYMLSEQKKTLKLTSMFINDLIDDIGKLEGGIKMTINENNLAKKIALKEGKKLELSIAQIKEVQKILLNELAKEKPSDVLKLLEKRKRK